MTTATRQRTRAPSRYTPPLGTRHARAGHTNGGLYAYAANSPVCYTDPDGEFIIMFGASATTGAGTGCSVNVGYFLCMPSDGSSATIGSYSITQIGAYVGWGASAGFELTIAPFAKKFSDIEGFSLVAGGSQSVVSFLPPGIGLGGEVGFNPSAETTGEKLRSLTVAVSLSVSSPLASTPAEGHIWTAFTQKNYEVNAGDWLSELALTVRNYINEGDWSGLADYLNAFALTIPPLDEW